MTERAGSGRRALITGASAGIGTALAEVFAEAGFDLVLTARRRERLEEIAGELSGRHQVRAEVIVADLSDASSPRAIFDETERRGLTIDVLVNNAGFGSRGYFQQSPWSVHADFLQVLVTAVVQLTYLYTEGMAERGYGRILNVSSLAGLLPGSPGRTLYGAAKSFLIKFSEALGHEHADDGIHVTALCPGFTYSEFHDVVGNREQVSRLPRFLWMSADDVARLGYRAVMNGKPVVVSGSANRAIAWMVKHAPDALSRGAMGRQANRMGIATDKPNQ